MPKSRHEMNYKPPVFRVSKKVAIKINHLTLKKKKKLYKAVFRPTKWVSLEINFPCAMEQTGRSFNPKILQTK